MRKILANDGISHEGAELLQKAGFELFTEKIEQENLINYINDNKIDVIIVRSATQVRENIIDACPNLKIIARAGVGVDNIDIDYASGKGIEVINTPLASAPSVAELVFAHLFSINRSLYHSNRYFHQSADSFKELKKKYVDGHELTGKTLGIVGFGRVGQSVAKRALGLGMKVIANDPFVDIARVKLDISGTDGVEVKIKTVSIDEVLKNSDFITLHIPLNDKAIITKEEISKMKDGVVFINVSRGDIVNEDDLIEALKSNKISFAGLDVFCNEPNPREDLLKLENVSVTPHISGATVEAQARIGLELAERIINYFNN
jgi:D-3-phosphoglycerate dehydrogenase